MFLRIKHAFQRAIRGYDDTAYWNLDQYIAEIALPVLKDYKESKTGTPATEDENGELTFDEERWQKELDKMIDAFQLMSDECELKGEWENPSREKIQEMEERTAEGLDSFGRYFRALWS